MMSFMMPLLFLLVEILGMKPGNALLDFFVMNVSYVSACTLIGCSKLIYMYVTWFTCLVRFNLLNVIFAADVVLEIDASLNFCRG